MISWEWLMGWEGYMFYFMIAMCILGAIALRRKK